MTTELERRIAELETHDKDQLEHCKDQVKECAGVFKTIDSNLAAGSKKMAIHEEGLKTLKTEQNRLCKKMDRVADKLDSMDSRITTQDQALMDKINGLEIAFMVGRPSWAVALIIAAALSIITGLTVRLI